MSSRLLAHAISQSPELVLDLGVGSGWATAGFISTGSTVVGIDVKDAPFEHEKYTHIKDAFEIVEPEEDTKFDLVWCTDVLQSVPNVQAFLVKIANLIADDGWLYLSVHPYSQDRLHIGNLSVWTPAHLVYNLICAGYDCKKAQWYTEYNTIGLCVRKLRIDDMTWRTGDEREEATINLYSPVHIRHDSGAWWANNWPQETSGRVNDPPLVTIGEIKTNLPPKNQLAYGPNPALRKEAGSWK